MLNSVLLLVELIVSVAVKKHSNCLLQIDGNKTNNNMFVRTIVYVINPLYKHLQRISYGVCTAQNSVNK